MPGSDATYRARQIATDAHRARYDLAGKPYLAHVYRVMQAVPERLRIVARLHDVVEDAGDRWPLERLRAEGFEPWMVEAIDALTRRRGEPYADYIRRVAANPDARAVKLADLADNLDARRLPQPLSERDRKRIRKYEEARDVLLGQGST